MLQAARKEALPAEPAQRCLACRRAAALQSQRRRRAEDQPGVIRCRDGRFHDRNALARSEARRRPGMGGLAAAQAAPLRASRKDSSSRSHSAWSSPSGSGRQCRDAGLRGGNGLRGRPHCQGFKPSSVCSASSRSYHRRHAAHSPLQYPAGLLPMMQLAARRRAWACFNCSNSCSARGEICKLGCRAIGMRLVRLMAAVSSQTAWAAGPAA